MAANLSPAFRDGRFERLVEPLNRLAASGPAEFAEWRTLALRGATAATHGDGAGVRGSCGACHHSYRELYRATLRTRPIEALLDRGGEP
jgi:hypothetical protein